MKAQRDADVMTALMRQSEVFDVTFATVTRERDEARKANIIPDLAKFYAHEDAWPKGWWKCGLCGNEYPRDVVIACPSCVFSLDGVDTALAGAKS